MTSFHVAGHVAVQVATHVAANVAASHRVVKTGAAAAKRSAREKAQKELTMQPRLRYNLERSQLQPEDDRSLSSVAKPKPSAVS
jgi:hypothetical protein